MTPDTDRALLEAAARAAGIRITSWNTQHGVPVAVLDDGTFWQPLLANHITDCMGDALRLAVKLRLRVDAGYCGCADVYGHMVQATESLGADPAAATRRAIVTAAAAMAPEKEQA